MHKDHKIIWQKWADPFGEDDIQDIISKEMDDEEYYDGYKAETIQEEKPIPIKRVKVIATPMGIIPVNENTASSKIFNFWVGHTNFDITEEVSDIIEHTSGVECLDIFTRYRFRIAIGKAFNDSAIMSSIQESVYNYLEKHDIK